MRKKRNPRQSKKPEEKPGRASRKDNTEISVFNPKANQGVEFEVMEKRNGASDDINMLLNKLQNDKADDSINPWLIEDKMCLELLNKYI